MKNKTAKNQNKDGARREVPANKKEPEKKPPQRIKGWDSNRWENSNADGIA